MKNCSPRKASSLMFFRRFCLILSLLLWEGAVSAQDQATKDQGEQDFSERSAKRKEFKQLVVPASKDPGCPDGRVRRDSELCAQWKVVDASIDSANASKEQVVIGWAGLGLGFATVMAAIAAAWYAKMAADSAIQANRSTRAWIIFENFSYGPFKNGYLNGQKVENGFAFIANFRNIGQTPAFKVGVEGQKAHIALEAAAPDFKKLEPKDNGGVIPQNIPFQSKPFYLDDQEWASFRNRNEIIYINIEIYYYDIFGQKRTTEVCARILHQGGQLIANGEPVDAITISTDGPRNHVD